jgi:hypothetical protein
MPIHDWTRVSAGTFHDFHLAWIIQLRNALNGGLLPEDYYTQAEAQQALPSLVTVKMDDPAGSEPEFYARKKVALVVHRSDDDRVIARLEIVSPGDKSSKRAWQKFLDRAAASLSQRINLLITDLHPPTKHDPHGVHGALWAEIEEQGYIFVAEKPLTLAAYAAGKTINAYVEPAAVGDPLPAMPLFLDHDCYVSVPLEATYQAAWRGVPRPWQKVLEG